MKKVFLMINRLVDRKIVRGIRRIIGELKIITEGNLNVMIAEHGNQEFKLLSNSINQMVSNIKNTIQHNDSLIQQQKANMDKNHELIRNINEMCENVDQVSLETLHNSESIHKGTDAQESALANLRQTMLLLFEQLKDSAGNRETSYHGQGIIACRGQSLGKPINKYHGSELPAPECHPCLKYNPDSVVCPVRARFRSDKNAAVLMPQKTRHKCRRFYTVRTGYTTKSGSYFRQGWHSGTGSSG